MGQHFKTHYVVFQCLILSDAMPSPSARLSKPHVNVKIGV